jgi:hypothetical protein
MSTFAARGRNWSMVGTISDTRLDDMGADYALKKARQTVVAAQANVIASGAVRTGALLHSIRMDHRERAGSYTTITVRAGAGHAAFVHEGTTGPIVAKTSVKGLRVPKFKYGTLKIWRSSVRGQAANPFLSTAMESAFATARSPFGPSGLLSNFSF